jgi:hypothetical protein
MSRLLRRAQTRKRTKKSSAASPPVTQYIFGALTRAGHGGIPAPVGATAISGGTATGYTIIGGNIVPSAHGSATAGTVTFTGSATVVTMQTPIADAYSVGTGELAAVLALNSVVDGKVIYGRPGADLCGTAPGSKCVVNASTTLNAGLKITSHDPLNRAYLRRLEWRRLGTADLWIDKLIVRDTFVPGVDFNDGSALLQGLAGTMHFRASDCEVSSDAMETLVHKISGTGATLVGNVLNLSAATPVPGLSTIQVPANGARVRIDGLPASVGYDVTAVDNVAKTLTLAGSPTITTGAWEIGNVLSLVGISTAVSTAGANARLTVTGCKIHDVARAIRCGDPKHIDVTDNDLYRFVNDGISISVKGDESSVKIERNRISASWGEPTHPQNSHSDGIQFITTNMLQTNTAPYRVIGNVISTAGGDTKAVQAIFFEGDTTVGVQVLAIIEHNIIHLGSRSGIVLQSPAPGSKIRYNTLVPDTPTDGVYPPTLYKPWIIVNEGTTLSQPGQDSGVEIAYNACASIKRTAAVLIDNYQWLDTSPNTDAELMSAGLTGPSFNSASIATIAQIMAAVTPNPANPNTVTNYWPAGQTRRGARGGYYDYATGENTAP